MCKKLGVVWPEFFLAVVSDFTPYLSKFGIIYMHNVRKV